LVGTNSAVVGEGHEGLATSAVTAATKAPRWRQDGQRTSKVFAAAFLGLGFRGWGWGLGFRRRICQELHTTNTFIFKLQLKAQHFVDHHHRYMLKTTAQLSMNMLSGHSWTNHENWIQIDAQSREFSCYIVILNWKFCLSEHIQHKDMSWLIQSE